MSGLQIAITNRLTNAMVATALAVASRVRWQALPAARLGTCPVAVGVGEVGHAAAGRDSDCLARTTGMAQRIASLARCSAMLHRSRLRPRVGTGHWPEATALSQSA